MKSRLFHLTFLLGLLLPAASTAHHGRDFLVVQDYYLPGLNESVFLTNFEYSRTGTDYELGIEPEILITVLPRVAVGVSVGFTDQTGMGWAYESVTPSVQIQLSPPDSDFPIRFALSVGYEFARETGGHAHGTTSTASSSQPSTSKSSNSSSRRRSSSSSSRQATGGTSSGGGSGVQSLSSIQGGGGSQTVSSAAAPVSLPAVAAAPADYGETAVPTPVPAPATTSNCPDLGPDAPPCPNPGTGTGGGSGGAGGGHDHGGGSNHSHTGGTSHDHGGGSNHSQNHDDHNHGDDEAGHAHEDGKKGHHDHQNTIHTHGQDALISRLIMETDLGDDAKLVVNLINVLPDDSTAAWGYAVGIRQNLSHSLSLSLEAIGDFSADGYHDLSLGAIVVPNHHLSLKLGAGMGLTPASPDLSLRGGVVWRF